MREKHRGVSGPELKGVESSGASVLGRQGPPQVVCVEHIVQQLLMCCLSRGSLAGWGFSVTLPQEPFLYSF